MRGPSVPAQRIAHAHNKALGQRGFDNYVYFDWAGNSISHPPAPIVFPILRKRIKPREAQEWLERAHPVYFSRTSEEPRMAPHGKS